MILICTDLYLYILKQMFLNWLNIEIELWIFIIYFFKIKKMFRKQYDTWILNGTKWIDKTKNIQSSNITIFHFESASWFIQVLDVQLYLSGVWSTKSTSAWVEKKHVHFYFTSVFLVRFWEIFTKFCLTGYREKWVKRPRKHKRKK